MLFLWVVANFFTLVFLLVKLLWTLSYKITKILTLAFLARTLKFLIPLIDNILLWLLCFPLPHLEVELWLQDLFLLILKPYSDCELTLVRDLSHNRPLWTDPRLFLILILVLEALPSLVWILLFLLNIFGSNRVRWDLSLLLLPYFFRSSFKEVPRPMAWL